MHFKPKGVLGIAVPVLLGGALAAGALALPAHAQSYQDTAVSAGTVTDETPVVSVLGASDGTSTTISLTGTNVSSWSLNSAPANVSVSGTTNNGAATISCTSCTMDNTAQTVVADAKNSNGNAEALVISVVIPAANSIQLTAIGSFTTDTVTGLTATNNNNGTVTFSATSKVSITYGESNLPTGLTSGNPTLTYVNGTAAPDTYSGVVATATDSDGAVLNGTFTLTVDANTVTSSSYGDEVNKFSYGFDSYRQHDYAGAIIVGWTATSSDPATHFLMNSGTTSGYYQFEYAPSGSGAGLCVSDPGGGWGSDPLRDGLILANCNNGPFQQFLPQSDGTLKNLATGLIVNPAGKGGQLRGGSSAVGWGGSSYTWTNGE